MPVYQVVHSGIPFTLTQRDRLARGMTKIHHDVTNAPEPFVRIVFQPAPFGTIYTAGEIAPSIVVNGNIRDGRSQAARQEIIQRIYDLVIDVTDATPSQIVVALHEVPNTWIMEAGYFMPAANDADEDAWIATLQRAYPGEFDEWGSGGKAPSLETDEDEQTRLQRLRALTERYAMIARRNGHDVKSLLGQLADQLDVQPAGSGRN